MADKEVDRRKINWKRAFHILKREALKRFRIKHFSDLDKYFENARKTADERDSAKNIDNLAVDLDKFSNEFNNTLYADLTARSKELVKSLQTGLNVDNLGKVLVQNIVNDLKSRSSSSASSKPSSRLDKFIEQQETKKTDKVLPSAPSPELIETIKKKQDSNVNAAKTVVVSKSRVEEKQDFITNAPIVKPKEKTQTVNFKEDKDIGNFISIPTFRTDKHDSDGHKTISSSRGLPKNSQEPKNNTLGFLPVKLTPKLEEKLSISRPSVRETDKKPVVREMERAATIPKLITPNTKSSFNKTRDDSALQARIAPTRKIEPLSKHIPKQDAKQGETKKTPLIESKTGVKRDKTPAPPPSSVEKKGLNSKAEEQKVEKKTQIDDTSILTSKVKTDIKTEVDDSARGDNPFAEPKIKVSVKKSAKKTAQDDEGSDDDEMNRDSKLRKTPSRKEKTKEVKSPIGAKPVKKRSSKIKASAKRQNADGDDDEDGDYDVDLDEETLSDSDDELKNISNSASNDEDYEITANKEYRFLDDKNIETINISPITGVSIKMDTDDIDVEFLTQTDSSAKISDDQKEIEIQESPTTEAANDGDQVAVPTETTSPETQNAVIPQIDNESGEVINVTASLTQGGEDAQATQDIQETQETQEITENQTGEENADESPRIEAQEVEIFEEEKQEFRKRKDEKPLIPDDHFYEYDSLIFKPVISEESNLPQNILHLFHSFGYDCKKRSNLNMLDPDTLVFSAGNMTEILNIRTKEQTYLRTTSGGGVGAIAVHPSRNYFAVGEKGNVPNINVFEYPSLKLYRILREGTIKGYAYLDFNTQGDLLASLGTAPDFMLTLWDWRQENVVLRTKAFSQDVYKVTFSKDLKGILTTAGVGHIKFWKMANTFTGFKLQGEIGKFGKTEISDIDGYTELPDGKVLSGCEWGNMLLWDGGLIQTEICRKKNKPCHIGSIQQITIDENDIYTISEDGTVRVWDFETIDNAEPGEEGTKLEIEPLNELVVGKNVALRSMVKDAAEESTFWYAQDSNGGIWRLDLSFGASSEYPRQLFSYHAGVIYGLDTCPNSHLLATTADDGSVKVYNYLTFEIAVQRKFSRGGSSLKWLPTTIDPEGSTILVGFNDGVLRSLKLVYKGNTPSHKEAPYELVLYEVHKPHTKAITSIAIDSKNEIIATGSDDNTVFFFLNSRNKRTPIGFVNLPSAVTYMCWTPAEYKNNRLLVCMKDGSVFEFDAPVPSSYDTSKTYLIEMKLNCRKYKFKSIKSRLRHEEELERKRKEEEERKKKEAEERRLRGEDDVDEKSKKKDGKKDGKKEGDKEEDESKQGGDEQGEEKKEEKKKEAEEPAPEEKPKEDEWKPYIPEIPSKICWAVYSSPDTFWLSMDDYDAGYLYECKFLTDAEKTRITTEKIDEPFGSVAVFKSDLTHNEDVPLTYLAFNKSKTHAFIGEKNGVIRYQPMPDTKSIRDLQHYWSYGYHDNEYGRITNISLSFDERFVFSAGADSNIFGCLFNSPPEALEKAREERIRVATKTDLTETQDTDDPNAYSIEQAKQKAEYDKMMATAEGKKQDMREKIYQLRKSFKELVSKNDQLVPRLRLEKHDFMLEESIKEQVLNQIDEKIHLTYRELAWYAEKCRLSLEKIKSRFKDVIDCEHLVVYTFDAAFHVSTFRCVQLPRDIDDYETELVRQYTLYLSEKQKTKDAQELQGSGDKDGKSGEVELQGASAAEQMKKIFGKLRGSTAARVERALRRMDEKKLKRLKRKKEWEELTNARLPDEYENPEDLASIKDAQDNLGDFKLKMSDNYIVPEEQRMNVFKATKRLIAIKKVLHKNQMIFNKKVVKLRDNKVKLVDEINKDVDRLEQIQFILSQNEFTLPTRPQIRPEEVPEKQLEYNKEKLIEFKKEMEAKAGSLEKAGNEDEGGLGGFASGAAAPKKQAVLTETVATASSDNSAKTQKFDNLKPLWHNREMMSSLIQKKAQIEEIKLLFEQKQLLTKIEKKIAVFDAELKLLRHEKAQVSILNKNIDLRHVTLYEEFMLLRDFEKTENELEKKLESRKEEHLDMQGKLTEIQMKINSKLKDLEKLDEKQKELLSNYQRMTQDETKFADFLSKVYKRKIKRKKKTEGAEEEEESEEESDESESEDEDEDEDDDDSEAEAKEQFDLDMCPTGLSQDLYDQVCQLREKRLDLEELQAEEKKILEQFKKDQETAIKRGKVAENSLKQAQQELENFQKEKQKKLNNLDIVVTMRFDQIRFMEKGYLPSDLTEALVFDARNLDRLQERINELQVEKVNEKKRFRSLKDRHLELIRDKKKMEEYINNLEEVSNKMMVDKFGKLVDLEKLELIAVNQQIEELKQRMAENEFEHERIMREWLDKINNQKDESIDLLRANTDRINEMVDIMSEGKRLEKFLNSKQKNLGDEFSGITKKDVEERERLHTLVQLQAQEIEALKAEISILSRKGGHILPPAQPPSSQMQPV